MRRLLIILCVVASVMTCGLSRAQDESPFMIKINRIVFAPGNKYTFYIPTFEFHMFFQKEFDVMKSAVTADYDFNRGDMGFGMSHALSKYAVNPGVSVDDNLFFREVFSDSTGIWRRKQAVTPFLMHNLSEESTIGMEFKIEREWSPDRRMGTKIVSTKDRSLKIYFLNRDSEKNNSLLYVSIERSYKVFDGEFNYLLIEVLNRLTRDISKNLRYRSIFNYRGNLTDQDSPLFFIGGRSNLIGFENDELWGRTTFSWQNLMEVAPFPEFSFEYKWLKIKRISILSQCDLGRVKGSVKIPGFKTQNDDVKVGLGTGVGFNTDLPYMPSTDIHIILAVPSNDFSSVKYYAGFGGWIN